ncbi:MAG: polysaccharide biosynthesis protein [Acutalibacteraceae bacterium]
MRNFNFRKILLILADAVFVGLSGILSYYILELADFSNSNLIGRSAINHSVDTPYVAAFIVVNIIVCCLCLWITGAYNKVWMYLSIRDYVTVGLSIVMGMIISDFFLVIRYNTVGYAMVFLALSAGISIVETVLFRIIFKQVFIQLTDFGATTKRKRTLIVGAGESCRIILREIDHAKKDPDNSFNNYLPVAIVDDDKSLANTKVDGVLVMGSSDDIPTICKTQNIDTIFFAIPSCDEESKRKIIRKCSETSCTIKMIPGLSELIEKDGPQILNQVRDINFNDLLGRDPITFDKESVAKFIKGKVCMVTGGGGSIGSELVRQLATYVPKQIIIVDIYENNAYDIEQELLLEHPDIDVVTLIASVRDYEKMDIIFKKYRPNIVFHAAAHKHVPLMETSPEEAVKNNIFGTFNMATLAEFYEADKFVMISTDKAVNPTNVMGATKRCCEMIVQYKSHHSSKTEFVTTRFGNVLGSNGSVIPLFRRQIESGKPLTVTHPDIIRYFMTIPEAVSLVLQAASMAKGGEIFVMDMGAPVKIVTLAENLCRMYGKVPYKDVPIVFTGLRPGEKLYEELLMDEEGLKETANKKIFIGQQIDIDEGDLLHKLDLLEQCSAVNDSEKTVEILEQIVPTFHHKSNK